MTYACGPGFSNYGNMPTHHIARSCR